MIIDSSQIINWILQATISLLCGAVGAYIVLRYEVKRGLNKEKREVGHTHKDTLRKTVLGSGGISPSNNIETTVNWARVNTITSAVLVLSMIAVILAIGTLITMRNQILTLSPNATAKDVFAPISIPFARIQSLDVIKNGNIIDTVNPDGKIMLTVGWNGVARVNVISNLDVGNLVYIWEFCHPENNLVGQGATEIPFILSSDGQDCIAVKVMQGDEFLDIAHFFISIK